jgi:hypothetical protein
MTPKTVTARRASDEAVATFERGDCHREYSWRCFPVAVLRTGAALAVTVLVSLVAQRRNLGMSLGSIP